MDFSKKYDNPSPEEKANIFSKLLYCWLFPIFKYGYKNDLETKDLYSTAKCDYSEQIANSLESNWEKELTRAKEKSEQPELGRAIRATFIKSFSCYGVSLLVQALGIRMTQPVILAALIRQFEEPRDKMGYKGWLLAMGIVLMAFLNIVIMHHSIIGLRRIGMRVRVAVCSLIYRKLLRLNKSSIAHTAAGQVVNLLSNDVNRFDIATELLHYIWIMPIATVVAGAVMYNLIGYSALVGIFAMALQAVPLQGYLSRLQGKYRFQIANCTDGRVQLMNEITSGIQVIKMYAWEKPFQELVARARKIEIDLITKTSYIRGVLVGMMVFTERFTLYLTVITYVLAGNKLTGDKVFAAAQIFNTIQLYMVILYPLGISFFAEAKSSVKRIEMFLSQEEFTPTVSENEVIDSKSGTIKISNAKASWVKNPIIDTLSYINLEIRPGTLCALVGQVGSGKSSILQMLLNELPLNHGHMEISGSISYASQEPWLFVSTIRNNILFGQPFNKKRYTEVVRVCALERDFELFPNKDHTLVGEKGVSLSGGQRARINLARAVYRQADIYLFDDPLSAVDTHVGKHLFEECILKYLGDKTRILVTHQLQFMKHVDQIVVLNNGQIDKVGSYAEMADNELNYIKSENEATESEEEEKKEKLKQRPRMMSVVSYNSTAEGDEEEPEETQELMERGGVSGSLYMAYLREGGSMPFLIFFAFMFIIAQVACNASDIWLTRWTNDEGVQNYKPEVSSVIVNGNNVLVNTTMATLLNPPNETVEDFENLTTTTMEGLLNLVNSSDLNSTTAAIEGSLNLTNSPDLNSTAEPSGVPPIHTQTTYIYVYTILIILSIVLILNRSFMFFKICMNSSKGLHNTMFGNILKATMRFFDTNPSGRILNRFSKDMGIVDEMLPRATLDAMQIFMVMFGILIMVFIVTPWMILPTIVLTVILYFLKNIYLASAQDIKRLEGITKSPAFSHVTASLSGLTTIRASNAQAMIIKEFDTLQDQHSAAWFLFLATSEAFGFYLDLISLTFIGIVTFQFVIFDDGTTLAGEVGLAISQSLILTGMIQYGMRQTAEVTSQMISVERIIQYMHLDKEGPFESTPTKKPNRDWPKMGKVSFDKVTLSYVPDEPPILKNLNFNIEPGEKVGIVGRTGAGKSSLIAALFRLAPTEGAIVIDDVNIGDIGLYDLRSKISIIPQEPVLFSASVRHNLDPVNKSEDAILWKALENVELKEVVENLNQEINEGGSNFSVGQRQLVCLARAIIRNNKILVMDEATANVDPQTDALIQAKIRENFKDCTVLTIAHRLNTVIDSDKVLVMDAGRAVEFGHPHELLKDPEGYLSKMVKETGSNMEHKLREAAEECYKTRPKVVEDQIQQNGSKKDV